MIVIAPIVDGRAAWSAHVCHQCGVADRPHVAAYVAQLEAAIEAGRLRQVEEERDRYAALVDDLILRLRDQALELTARKRETAAVRRRVGRAAEVLEGILRHHTVDRDAVGRVRAYLVGERRSL